MEYFKALDRNGNDTGRKLERSRVHGPKSDPEVYCETSHVWVYNSLGEVLMQLRSRQKMSHGGKWDIAAAGHVDFGEDSVHGAIREISEEIGIIVEPKNLELIAKRESHGGVPPENWIHNEFANVYLYKCDLPAKAFIFEDGEVTEVKWIPLGLLEDEVHNLELVKKYVPHGDYYDFVVAEIRKRSN